MALPHKNMGNKRKLKPTCLRWAAAASGAGHPLAPLGKVQPAILRRRAAVNRFVAGKERFQTLFCEGASPGEQNQKTTGGAIMKQELRTPDATWLALRQEPNFRPFFEDLLEYLKQHLEKPKKVVSYEYYTCGHEHYRWDRH